jgi:hypothetical protein
MPDFRLEGGYSEIIASALRDKTTSPLIEKIQSILTIPGARGDFVSNVFGGYAFIRQQMNEGKTKAEAVKNYEYETLRQQQSSLKSSKGNIQEYSGIANRLLLTFKSNSIAVGRKIFDSRIQYLNGEISGKQFVKTIALYTAENALVITLVKMLVTKIKNRDDDKRKKKKADPFPEFMLDLFNESIQNLTFGFPIVSELTDYSLNRIEKEFIPEHQPNSYQFAIQTPFFDDLAKGLNGLSGNKKERNLLPALQFGIEAMTAIPVKNILDYTGTNKKAREVLTLRKKA